MTVKNDLPNFPLIESPLFAEHYNRGTFGDHTAVARDLHNRGYAVINIFNNSPDGMAKIDKVNEEMKSFFESDQYREQDSWEKYNSVAEIALEDSILDILRVSYGREPFPFQTLAFPKGTEQGFHSDAVHFSSWPHGFMCGVWTALEDISLESGPLFYYPGTHKLPYIESYHIGYEMGNGVQPTQEIYYEYWDSAIKSIESEREVFLAKKGQSLIWTANLIHGGMPVVNSTLTRKSIVTHYYFEDCYYYTPMLSDVRKGNVFFRNPKRVVKK